MKLATKLGLGAIGLGILANIYGRDLSKYYSNQRKDAAVVLDNTIQKNPGGIDKAIDNFEKYEGRKSDANLIRDTSYIALAFGVALALSSRIKINPYIE